MQNQLLKQLDSKVRALIDEVEVLRVEIEELKIINKHIKTTYSGKGYDYFILPKDSVEQRVNFIIKTIK